MRRLFLPKILDVQMTETVKGKKECQDDVNRHPGMQGNVEIESKRDCAVGNWDYMLPVLMFTLTDAP